MSVDPYPLSDRELNENMPPDDDNDKGLLIIIIFAILWIIGLIF